jgi:predicted small secreted protein
MSDRTLSMLGAAPSGWNTVRGVAQDVEAAGDTISDVADDPEDERRGRRMWAMRYGFKGRPASPGVAWT